MGTGSAPGDFVRMDETEWTKSPKALREHASYLDELAEGLPLTGPTLERLRGVAKSARDTAEDLERAGRPEGAREL